MRYLVDALLIPRDWTLLQTSIIHNEFIQYPNNTYFSNIKSSKRGQDPPKKFHSSNGSHSKQLKATGMGSLHYRFWLFYPVQKQHKTRVESIGSQSKPIRSTEEKRHVLVLEEDGSAPADVEVSSCQELWARRLSPAKYSARDASITMRSISCSVNSMSE